MEVKVINNIIVKSWVNDLDEHGQQEVNILCQLPFIHHHLALIPDAHRGY